METPMHTNKPEFRRFRDASESYLSESPALRNQLRNDIDAQTKAFLASGGRINQPSDQGKQTVVKIGFNNQHIEVKE